MDVLKIAVVVDQAELLTDRAAAFTPMEKDIRLRPIM
jgi:hypothetical protein